MHNGTDNTHERSQLYQRVSRTPREKQLFDKYLAPGSVGPPPATADATPMPSAKTQLESSNRLLALQRQLSERELQLVETKSQHLRLVNELQDIRSQFDSTLHAHDAELRERNRRISELEAKINQIGSENEGLHRLKLALREKDRELDRTRAEFTTRLNEKHKDIEQLTSQLGKQKQVIELLAASQRDYKTRVQDLESKLQHVQQPVMDTVALDALAAECEHYRGTAYEQEVKIRELETAIAALEDGIKQAESAEVAKLKRIIDEQNSKIVRLSAQAGTLTLY